MLVFVENQLYEGQIPEIWETEEEKSIPFKELRDFYIKYARSHFQGRKYTNECLRKPILVSRDGIDKMKNMMGLREQCIAIQLLDKFLIESEEETHSKDKKNRHDVDEFIYLQCFCKINGKPYKIRIYTKKTVNNPLKFYGYILMDIKIEATRR